MELVEVQVVTRPSLTLPWDEVFLFPVGDVQYGAQGADLDKFKRHIDFAMKYDNSYFMGMGDMVDVASPSNRTALRNAPLYDSVRDALESKAREQMDVLSGVLKGTEDRWLGAVEGHHYFEFSDGTTTDEVLADRLNCPFLGTCGIVQVGFKGREHRSIKAQIWVHHGTGSGATMAAPINKLERMASRFPTVDIFLVGHYSRKVAYPVDALVPVFGKNPRLKAKRRILACTGGFMKGYTAGNRVGGRKRGSYVEQGMMAPTNLGGILIKIRPVHSEHEDRLDMSVEL